MALRSDRYLAEQTVEQGESADLIDLRVQQPLGLQPVGGGDDEGGHLLLLDNPRIAGIDLRAGLYRKEAGRFVVVAETEHAPEIADLVRSEQLTAA